MGAINLAIVTSASCSVAYAAALSPLPVSRPARSGSQKRRRDLRTYQLERSSTNSSIRFAAPVAS